jgi:phosphoglycolate phosphatase
MMQCKLVIFDFDGTLANTLPFVLSMLDELADEFKKPRFNHGDLPHIRNYSPAKIMRMHKVRIWQLPSILKFTRLRMHSDAHLIDKFEGIDEVIRSLSTQEIKLGIVTTNTRQIVEQVLGSELFKLFDYFIGEVSLFGKPKALKKVLSLAGCQNSETLAIGDELRDLDAAAKVRIPFGAVSWGFSTPEALRARNPLFTFTTPAQILENIDSATAF